MDQFVKVTVWTLSLTFITGIITAASNINPSSLKDKSSSPSPIIYVTPSSIPEENKAQSKSYKVQEDDEEILSTAASKRSGIAPFRLSFQPTRDQLRLQTKNNYQRPAKTAPRPILSSSKDLSLTNPDKLADLPVPATYESIVYNPDTKEASSAFSRSNFWETPELVIKDTNQREEGKNSLIETSSRVEYTPNIRSIQTPLNQIRYRNQPVPSSTRPLTYKKPTPETPKVIENQEESEEESQNQESEEENEELNEEEEEVEDDEKPRYPVNLEEIQHPFNPYENVQEPDDIYSDVLNNIGSVFNEENSSPIQNSPSKGIGANDPLPQFEQYSFENLQQQERDDVREDDGDYIEDNEDLEEYDDDEGRETKQIPQKKSNEAVTVKYHPSTTSHYQHRPNHEQKVGKTLQDSPFPNVKIIKATPPPKQQQQGAVSFSPWLPQQPTAQPISANLAPRKPWQQVWQQSRLQQQHQKPSPDYKSPAKIYTKEESAPKITQIKSERKRPYDWQNSGKINEKTDHERSPQTEHKPYEESYKTSYNKSWKTSSPEENENSSYKTSWAESSSEKPKYQSYKNQKNYSSTNKKTNKVETGKRPRKSIKPFENKISRSDSIPQNSVKDSNLVFVTPVPNQEQPKDNVATSSKHFISASDELENDSAVLKIDELYSQQHNHV